MNSHENTISSGFPSNAATVPGTERMGFSLSTPSYPHDSLTGVPCNAWWSPSFSIDSLLTEAAKMWQGAGGTIEPVLLWADHLTALRYQQHLLVEEEQTLRATNWPFRSVSDAILTFIQQTPFSKNTLDVFSLGSGAALHEQRLLQALQSANRLETIRTNLVDSSLSMLEMGLHRMDTTFPRREVVQLSCVHQNFLQWGQDSDWVQAIRHTESLPLVTLLGELFCMIPNEMRFLRHCLGFFPAHSLLLFDATEGYGPASIPKDLYKLDPFLNGQCTVRRSMEPFLHKVIQDHRAGSKRVSFQVGMDRAKSIVPGSYALEWQARVGDLAQFFIPHGRRYQIDALLSLMEEERWTLTDRWRSEHPNNGLYLFAKKPRSLQVQVPVSFDDSGQQETHEQLWLPASQPASADRSEKRPTALWSGYPMNAWMDPKASSVVRLQRLSSLLTGRGGALSESDLCLDEQAARDYASFLLVEQECFATERFPADTLADAVATYLDKTPLLPKSLDLLVLAEGGGENESHLIRALLQRTPIRDIQVYLVDANASHVRLVHEKYNALFSSAETVQIRSVVVPAMQLHRHPAWLTAFQQTNRLLLVATTGSVFSSISNELELVRNVFRLLPRRSLWLLDVPLVFAPSELPAQVRAMDPLFAQPQGRWHQFASQWLYGIFQRYRKTPAHYTLQTSLDRTAALVPGSYVVDVRVALDGESSFSVFKRTRYEEIPLLQLLEQSQWNALDGWFYNQGNRLAQLLEKT